MAKVSYQSLSDSERREALAVTAGRVGRPACLLEKDVWVDSAWIGETNQGNSRAEIETQNLGDFVKPKVFISYSWTDQAYKESVRHLADRMLQDGVDVILDVYDLQEGDDKYVFMERMVTDESVTHVLVISDKEYSEKANLRKAGVGTESQIISREVYEKVNQSKFIPIVCEFDERGYPFLPSFLQSRVWIDFSNEQRINENWERLIRLIYGKPEYIKPKVGRTPSYISSEIPVPATGLFGKFSSLKQAILNGSRGIGFYRSDFVEACLDYADELRVREQPKTELTGEKVLEDVNRLKLVRDPLVDWVLLEGEFTLEDKFAVILIEFLEKLRGLKSRPSELNRWSESWFEAHTLFVYETFLYFVAALLKTKSYRVLHQIYKGHYLRPDTERHGGNDFERFVTFWGYSKMLQSVLAPEGHVLHSPAAELLKRHADRQDFPFSEIIQAEILTLLMFFLTPDCDACWYAQTLYYSSYGTQYPFFIRAAQHERFKNMATVTGIENADVLRSKVREGLERWGQGIWLNSPVIRMPSAWSLMNAEKWDTLR